MKTKKPDLAIQEERLCDALYDHDPAAAMAAIKEGATGAAFYHFSAPDKTGRMMAYAVPVGRAAELGPLIPAETVLYNATVMAMDLVDKQVGGTQLPERFMALLSRPDYPEQRLRGWLQRRRDYDAAGQPDMLAVARALMNKGEPPRLFRLEQKAVPLPPAASQSLH